MRFSIVIPCYNESDNIPGLVTRLNKLQTSLDVEFILVENGSKDNSMQVLQKECAGKNRFQIVRVEENKGYGFGLITGLRKAVGDYVGWLHADLQVSPEDMARFMMYAEQEGQHEKLFLKGSRKNRSLVEHFFTFGMSVYASIVLRCVMHDIGALPVLFHRNLLGDTLGIAPYDFSIETYMYFMAKRKGMTIKRFDVNMHSREKGQSSWNISFKSKIRQSFLIAKDIIKIKRGVRIQ